jgi:type II secretory pathway pseudopilin PulG
MLKFGRRACRRLVRRSETGSTFVEVLVAVVILGLIAASIPPAIIFSTRSVFAQKERTIAEYLTRNQVEYIKSSAYISGEVGPWDPDGYPDYSEVPVPDNTYEILVVARPIDVNDVTGEHEGYLAVPGFDEGIQEITIEVRHVRKEVLTTRAYKVER